MKNKYITCLLLISSIFILSCNTYKWQRKRYYNHDAKKNWNYYKSEKVDKSKSE
jgi:hypothetical protein